MLYNNIVSDIELLRNDVLLLLKHNFYLQCKLNQQDEQLNKLEQKYADRESRLSLEMAMLRQKYEK
jgi:glutathione peroxidase-family protein